MSIPGELFDVIWCHLTKNIDPDVAKKWRSNICTLYSEEQRHYHTLTHVEEMLSLRKTYCDKLNDVESIDYAIIFHDIIYNPKFSNNEEMSAELFKDYSNEVSLSVSMENKVCEMILATKQHQTAAHMSDDCGTLDIHYLIDFDMAVLGRNPLGYKEYATQIRSEYIHIPEKIYCVKRAEVLKNFLKIPHIYATCSFRDSCEDQARQNIQEEIESLTAKAASL